MNVGKRRVVISLEEARVTYDALRGAISRNGFTEGKEKAVLTSLLAAYGRRVTEVFEADAKAVLRDRPGLMDRPPQADIASLMEQALDENVARQPIDRR